MTGKYGADWVETGVGDQKLTVHSPASGTFPHNPELVKHS